MYVCMYVLSSKDINIFLLASYIFFLPSQVSFAYQLLPTNLRCLNISETYTLVFRYNW